MRLMSVNVCLFRMSFDTSMVICLTSFRFKSKFRHLLDICFDVNCHNCNLKYIVPMFTIVGYVDQYEKSRCL